MLYLALAAAGGILVVEFLLRIVIKSDAGRSEVSAHRFRDAMLAMAHHVELFSTTHAHPFLQYTRPRTTLSKGDQEYGFRAIRLSDVPKPEGVVRIACLGGASTEAGYPELLEAYLNDASRATQYQVLDFAVDGWSSLHGVLNFILNVREFHPDIIVIQDELTSAVCSGYPCSCPGGIHDYTPPPFQDNPLDERMLRISWIYRACKVLLGRSGVGAFSTDGRELRHYRRHIETICTLAVLENVKVILLTLPCASDDVLDRSPTRAANQIIREIARERAIALVDPENSSTDEHHPNGASDQMMAERIGKMIVSLHCGESAQ
jgi:hypothetical protein